MMYQNMDIGFQILCTLILLLVLLIVNTYGTGIDMGRGTYNCNPLLCYLQAFLGIAVVVAFCSLLNGSSSKIVKNISVGTISVMGFHLTILQCLWVIQGKLPKSIQWIVDSPCSSITTFVISCFVAVGLKKFAPILIGNRK